MQNKPSTMAEASDNLRQAWADFVVALAAAMAPVLKKLQDEGLVDKHGRLTPKANAMIRERRRERRP